MHNRLVVRNVGTLLHENPRPICYCGVKLIVVMMETVVIKTIMESLFGQ